MSFSFAKKVRTLLILRDIILFSEHSCFMKKNTNYDRNCKVWLELESGGWVGRLEILSKMWYNILLFIVKFCFLRGEFGEKIFF